MNAMLMYLHKNFLTENQLMTRAMCTYEELMLWQKNGIFPLPSYRTKANYNVTSFFGEHDSNEDIKWYPEELCQWVYLIRKKKYDIESLKASFFYRYLIEIDKLKNLNVFDDIYNDMKLVSDILEFKWRNFIKGTYGVCTKKSTPEHIAAKDLAIRVIDRITTKHQVKVISQADREILARAVEILDEVIAEYAPHEYERSSRAKCIDRVRNLYLL